jgi:DNA-binding transcriptional MerR regulator
VALVCLPPDPRRYSLSAAASLTGVHPEMLRYYCRLGLLDAHLHGSSSEPTFDDAALEELLRIEHYRRNLGVNRRALHLVCELWREAVRQDVELVFLRAK